MRRPSTSPALSTLRTYCRGLRSFAYAGTVVVPAPLLADPPPFFGNSIIAGVVMDPATDVHSVVVARFTLPSRANP